MVKEMKILIDISLIEWHQSYRFVLNLAHNRLELETGTYYGIFLRAYVKEDLFISTPWYPVVKTNNTLSKCNPN